MSYNINIRNGSVEWDITFGNLETAVLLADGAEEMLFQHMEPYMVKASSTDIYLPPTKAVLDALQSYLIEQKDALVKVIHEKEGISLPEGEISHYIEKVECWETKVSKLRVIYGTPKIFIQSSIADQLKPFNAISVDLVEAVSEELSDQGHKAKDMLYSRLDCELHKIRKTETGYSVKAQKEFFIETDKPILLLNMVKSRLERKHLSNIHVTDSYVRFTISNLMDIGI